MLLNGLILMVMGMGIVYIFLIVLIYSSKLTSWLITKFFPVKEVPVQPIKRTGGSSGSDAEVAAAVAAVRARR